MSRTDEELMMLVLSERTVLMSDEEDESVYSMCVTDNMSTDDTSQESMNNSRQDFLLECGHCDFKVKSLTEFCKHMKTHDSYHQMEMLNRPSEFEKYTSKRSRAKRQEKLINQEMIVDLPHSRDTDTVTAGISSPSSDVEVHIDDPAENFTHEKSSNIVASGKRSMRSKPSVLRKVKCSRSNSHEAFTSSDSQKYAVLSDYMKRMLSLQCLENRKTFQSHSRIMLCTSCTFITDQWQVMKSHGICHHRAEDLYDCTKCKHFSLEKDIAEAHTYLFHVNSNLFHEWQDLYCRHCDKLLQNFITFLLHKTIKHTDGATINKLVVDCLGRAYDMKRFDIEVLRSIVNKTTNCLHVNRPPPKKIKRVKKPKVDITPKLSPPAKPLPIDKKVKTPKVMQRKQTVSHRKRKKKSSNLLENQDSIIAQQPKMTKKKRKLAVSKGKKHSDQKVNSVKNDAIESHHQIEGSNKQSETEKYMSKRSCGKRQEKLINQDVILDLPESRDADTVTPEWSSPSADLDFSMKDWSAKQKQNKSKSVSSSANPSAPVTGKVYQSKRTKKVPKSFSDFVMESSLLDFTSWDLLETDSTDSSDSKITNEKTNPEDTGASQTNKASEKEMKPVSLDDDVDDDEAEMTTENSSLYKHQYQMDLKNKETPTMNKLLQTPSLTEDTTTLRSKRTKKVPLKYADSLIIPTTRKSKRTEGKAGEVTRKHTVKTQKGDMASTQATKDSESEFIPVYMDYDVDDAQLIPPIPHDKDQCYVDVKIREPIDENVVQTTPMDYQIENLPGSTKENYQLVGNQECLIKQEVEGGYAGDTDLPMEFLKMEDGMTIELEVTKIKDEVEDAFVETSDDFHGSDEIHHEGDTLNDNNKVVEPDEYLESHLVIENCYSLSENKIHDIDKKSSERKHTTNIHCRESFERIYENTTNSKNSEKQLMTDVREKHSDRSNQKSTNLMLGKDSISEGQVWDELQSVAGDSTDTHFEYQEQFKENAASSKTDTQCVKHLHHFHVLNVKNRYYFRCLHCQNVSRQESDMLEHSRTCCGDRLKMIQPVGEFSKTFKCALCKKSNRRLSDLVRHVVEKHPHTSDVRPFFCIECNLSFPTRTDVSKHIQDMSLESGKTHEFIFKKILREKQRDSVLKWIFHVLYKGDRKNEHESEEFVPEGFDESFHAVDDLTQITDSLDATYISGLIHNYRLLKMAGKKRYQCLHCQNVIFRETDIDSHTKTCSHRKQKIVPPSDFISNSYMCMLCYQCDNQVVPIVQHMVEAHSHLFDSSPFVCVVCNAGFLTSKLAALHCESRYFESGAPHIWLSKKETIKEQSARACHWIMRLWKKERDSDDEEEEAVDARKA